MDIQEIVAGIGSSQALRDLAAKAGMSPEQAQSAVQGVLEHVTSGQPFETIVEGVASGAGLDPAMVRKFLPNVMPLLTDHAQNATEGVQATLTGMLGSLEVTPLGGLLDNLGGVDGALGAIGDLLGKHG